MKHRDTCFAVVRLLNDNLYVSRPLVDAQVVGLYRTPEAAFESCDRYKQQVTDGSLPKEFDFEVQASVYYNE